MFAFFSTLMDVLYLFPIYIPNDDLLYEILIYTRTRANL